LLSGDGGIVAVGVGKGVEDAVGVWVGNGVCVAVATGVADGSRVGVGVAVGAAWTCVWGGVKVAGGVGEDVATAQPAITKQDTNTNHRLKGFTI
jgi:hypothetical protein